MIEDQEMLVSSLTQQGIPEPLICRHFERLLEEQRKQLQMYSETRLGKQKKVRKDDALKYKKLEKLEKVNYETQEKAHSINCNPMEAVDNPNCSCTSQITDNLVKENPEPQCAKQNEEERRICTNLQETNRQHRVEPSSLLKIRLQKEVVNTKKRNNGLQDDAMALEIIKNCNYKSKHAPSDNQNNFVHLKLNGTQDKSELENYQSMYIPDCLKPKEKRSSYNGLENTRNPQNPQFAPKSARCRALQFSDDASGVLYPPQRPYYQYSTTMMNPSNSSNREHCENCQYSNDVDSTPQAESQVPKQSSNNNYVEEYNTAQYANQNNLTYWPEFQEPKIIGGLTYFARKPQSIPKEADFQNHNQTE
jgi:hypothetical protein